MAEVGTEMVNPVTEERFVWRHTAGSTSGEFAEVDLFLGERAKVDKHVHPGQREDFRIEKGSIELSVEGEKRTLAEGDEDSVPPGIAHSWRSSGVGETHVVIRFTPALRTEDFFETYCGLARDGKANAKGVPRNLLQAAVLFHEFRAEIAPPPPAARALTPLIALLARIGARRGLQPRYPQYGTD